MTDTIRWGIIGCGNVCEVKSGPGFRLAEGSALTAVMRRDGAKAEDYATRHGVARWTTDANEIIEADDVDAVYVASPVGDHMDYALQTAAVGKPCYVEKPMARSRAECVRMVEAFEQAGQPLFVAYYRRGLPRFNHVKQLIADGTIGKVTSVSLTHKGAAFRNVDRSNLPWRVVAERSGGGLYFDLASHALDVVDYMLGPLTQVQGSAANIASDHDVEDVVSMSFAFAEDAPARQARGMGLWNFASDKGDDRIIISGTEGQIELATFGHHRVTLQRGGDETITEHPDPKHIQQPLIQSMVDQLRGKGACPSTGVSAARTAAVMDAATANYYGGRDDAFWQRPETWPGRRS